MLKNLMAKPLSYNADERLIIKQQKKVTCCEKESVNYWCYWPGWFIPSRATIGERLRSSRY